MFISPADFNGYRYVRSSQKWLTEEGLNSARELPIDAVLVSCIGYIGKVGMTFTERSATNQQIAVIKYLRPVDEKLAAEEDRKTALQAFFKSMLHQLMTGQVRLLSDEGLPVNNEQASHD
jgi:hypothetical protein